MAFTPVFDPQSPFQLKLRLMYPRILLLATATLVFTANLASAGYFPVPWKNADQIKPAEDKPAEIKPGEIKPTERHVENIEAPIETVTEKASELVAPPSVTTPIIRSPEQEIAALRPMLIGKRYLDQSRQRLAVQLARMSRSLGHTDAWIEDNALVEGDFVADVQLIYTLEFPEGAQLVSHGMMKSWGMDVERLHQRAMANLESVAQGEMKIKPVGKLPWLYVLDVADGYAASRSLLHWRWGALTLQLGEVLILGMPTSDVVVFTASLDPEKLAQLRDTVETVERHQGRPITRKLFQWTPQGWIEFKDADVEMNAQLEQPASSPAAPDSLFSIFSSLFSPAPTKTVNTD